MNALNSLVAKAGSLFPSDRKQMWTTPSPACCTTASAGFSFFASAPFFPPDEFNCSSTSALPLFSVVQPTPQPPAPQCAAGPSSFDRTSFAPPTCPLNQSTNALRG